MNTFLSHGLLDVGELNQMQFRNRSLQEFLAALWMARHCTDDDSAELSGWLYRTEEPLSEEYYWVWRFATEMPPLGRRADAWVCAMQESRPVAGYEADGGSRDVPWRAVCSRPAK